MTSEVNINITKEEAKRLYRIGDEALRDVALRAYPKYILDEEIPKEIIEEMCQSPDTFKLTSKHVEELTYFKDNVSILDDNPMIFLRILGLYFNKGWTRKLGRTKSNSGWFITKKRQKSKNSMYSEYELVWEVAFHSGVCYPGIVYFESQQGAEKAIEILGQNRLSKLYEPGIL